MAKLQPPKYAKIDGTEMRLKGKTYWRDAGLWGIEFKEVNGEFITKGISQNRKLKGLKIIEITEKEWREGNKGYL